MKPEDMQPEEHRMAAEAAAKLAYEASQLDWHDQNADKIRKKLGIEDVGGSFTCGRCKGNKTTYQAKQTRSSVRACVYKRRNLCESGSGAVQLAG
jgi:DNA-directed RNA polymerase subunit M/transcription elongation factor TFIIS